MPLFFHIYRCQKRSSHLNPGPFLDERYRVQDKRQPFSLDWKAVLNIMKTQDFQQKETVVQSNTPNPFLLRSHQARTRRLPTGVTLVELLIVLVITAILLTTVAPAFAGIIERYRVKSATEKLFLYLRHAKSEAIKRNQRIRLTFKSSNSGATWCYGLKIDATCDCTAEGSCQIDGVQKIIKSDEFPGVSIEPHISSPGDRFTFENIRWAMASTYGHVRFNSSGGKQTRVIVSSTSRIRLCSPQGSANISGYSTSC